MRIRDQQAGGGHRRTQKMPWMSARGRTCRGDGNWTELLPVVKLRMNQDAHRGLLLLTALLSCGGQGSSQRELGPKVCLSSPRSLSSLSANGTLQRGGTFQRPHCLPEGGGKWSPQAEPGFTTSLRLKLSPSSHCTSLTTHLEA